MTHQLTEYEAKQFSAIQAWKTEEPSVISKSLGTVFAPVSWLAHKFIPEKAIRSAISAAMKTADKLTDSGDIKKSVNVSDIGELLGKDLEFLDKLAAKVHHWAIGLATTGGIATGFGGALTLAADVPATVTLALRTIYQIGLCYGYEAKTDDDKLFILAVLALSSANSIGDKMIALNTLHAVRDNSEHASKPSPNDITGSTAEKSITKKDTDIGIDHLSKTIGLNLTKRKMLQLIPAVGAIVGGSVNGWYLKDVGWSARRAYQERWFADKYSGLTTSSAMTPFKQ
ncbi:EcsC family protein [uncultured Desulfobacter sp.]|uniref:EcsC family protein n=1 Tax=uncultured Desulfobacter sp. TaxID=240139 RepID=UPI002AA79AA8|nr:EcsC family protein [uncultured Desulfobacter sp.]